MDARLVAARLPGLAMYGSPYQSPPFPGYLPYGPAAAAAVAAASADPSAFYSHMGPGDNSDAWRAGLTQAAAAAYYDPAMAAHYGYGYGPMGLTDGARRKNATRETTSTLKAWLNEHRKNPYPTKGEKIMLAIITKMTLTQVSTWFANARRRLKKENKMTWSPRNRCGEDDEDDDMDDGSHSVQNNNSRSSTPVGAESDVCSQQSSTNAASSAGPERRRDAPRPNGHSSGGESMSDESAIYSDHPEQSSGSEKRDSTEGGGADSSAEKETSQLALSRLSEDARARHQLPSHFARHAIHPYANQRSSPPSMPANLSPGVQPGLRPGMPLKGGAPCPPPGAATAPHRMFHPAHNLSAQFNPAAAASLIAAYRGHPLPPHVMAALNEQAQMHHYQQALQNLPGNPMRGAQADESASGSESPSPVAPHSVSKSPQTPSSSSATSASPHSKPKIWSLADVATSGDTPKKSPLPSSSPPAQSFQTDARAVRHWMDDVLHQRAAAAALPGKSATSMPSSSVPMTPHQLQQLAMSLSSGGQHGSPMVTPQQLINGTVRTHPGFVDAAAIQEHVNASLRHQRKESKECRPDDVDSTHSSDHESAQIMNSRLKSTSTVSQ